MSRSRKVLLLGSGGHAKNLLDCLELLGFSIEGIASPSLKHLKAWRGYPAFPNDNAIERFRPDEIFLVNGIGFMPKATLARAQLFERWREKGYRFLTLAHPSAVIAKSCRLEPGCQVMAGAIIQSDTTIGANTIINTRAVVEHDCVLGANNHLASGAVLCGGVKTKDQVFIGAASVVKQNIKLGRQVTIGAGSTVLHNVSDGETVTGKTTKTAKKSNKKVIAP